jgi:Flp pilus assembly protein TadD
MRIFMFVFALISFFPWAGYAGQTMTAKAQSLAFMEAADKDVKAGNYDSAISNYFKALSKNKNDKELRKKLGAALTLQSSELRRTKAKNTGHLAPTEATGNSGPAMKRK